MRILHLSDLHFRRHWFEWLAAHGPAFDAVCFTGDFLDLFATQRISLREQTRWVRDWLREFRGRLFACSGNHDWWDTDDVVDTDAHAGWLRKMAGPNITVDGHGALCGGIHFHCHPYGARAALPATATGRWILLYHVPPALAATALGGSGGTRGGCTDLASALTIAGNPPWLVLSGHIHRPKSWRGRCGASWSLNPTFDEEASFPNHIVIDTADGTLTWISQRMGRWPLKVL